MLRLKFSLFGIALLLATATVVRADSGCVDSPENPTVVFGLITAAASLGLAHLRNRKGSRDK
jgi:XrtJ-associated TM-motif-TM protein